MPARLFDREQRERSRTRRASGDQALHFGRAAARRPRLVSRHRRPRRGGDRRRGVGAVGRGAGAVSPFSRSPTTRATTPPRTRCCARTLSRYRRPRAGRWRFDKTASGQTVPGRSGRGPRLVQPLAHSTAWSPARSPSDADVGVDVECVDRTVDTADIAARFFAPAEAAQLTTAGAARRDATASSISGR